MRRIRLTEGQLHNVIRESVNNILNEIDWKTYASAADKSERKAKDYWLSNNQDEFHKNSDRIRPLQRAANDAYRKKYPGQIYDLPYHHVQDPYDSLRFKKDRDEYNEIAPYDGRNLYSMSDQEKDDLLDQENELRNYQKGNYKYGKGGRGYYLK